MAHRWPTCAFLFVSIAACGSSKGAPGGVDAGADVVATADGGDEADVPSLKMCSNLQCRVDLNCASKARPETTLKGTVYDPAGVLGLYGVYVYVPNTAPDPITPGNPTCTPCEAPASGSPVIGGLTDANGHFTLARTPGDDWGVPGGDDIPLVVQAGKWRRQLTVPHVDDCTVVDLDAVLNAGSGTQQQRHQLRLPSKTAEGDMPLIAFTSGCDPAECFLRHIGIDDSEFVPPGSATGHVHFFTGQTWSSIAGGNAVAQTYQWWTETKNLTAYDVVFNACECTPHDRDSMGGSGDAYQAMAAYLDQGGRLFATHYYGDWFFDPGTPDLKSAVVWQLPPWSGFGNGLEDDIIDQTFPKGQAFAKWLFDAGVGATPGKITLNDVRDDMVAQAPSGCSTSNGTCRDTQWIVSAANQHPRYVTINTPVGKPPDVQCGRAVYSDVHLSGMSDGSQFPNECAGADPMGLYRVNETALEFLFFDLSSCVQDDGKPEPPPPAK